MGEGGDGRSFNFLQVLFEGVIAGGAAGVVVETALASVIFIGVYEPTKRNLLEMFPENLSPVAHLSC